MTEEKRGSEILGALPRTRPQRRSDKRPPSPQRAAARPPQATAPAPQATAQSPSTAARRSRSKAPPQTPSKRPSSAPPKAPPRIASETVPKPDPQRISQPAQPGGSPAGRAPRHAGATGQGVRQASASRAGHSSEPAPRGTPPGRRDPLTTAVQTAAEVAEFGLTLGTHALRRALSRLPRP